MRYLEKEDLIIARHWMERAVDASKTSRCQKSKRGVVIVKNGEEIGWGNNGPPVGYICDADCMQHCREYSVHAEMNAIYDALRKGNQVYGSRAYHMKSVDGKGVPKGTPSCVPCSKHLLNWGIDEIVLMDEKGFALYEMTEFHRLSLENSGLKR